MSVCELSGKQENGHVVVIEDLKINFTKIVLIFGEVWRVKQCANVESMMVYEPPPPSLKLDFTLTLEFIALDTSDILKYINIVWNNL